MLQLPPEVLESVLEYLDAPELARVRRVCRSLFLSSSQDRLWRRLCVANVFAHGEDGLGPFESYHELYASMHQHLWFNNSAWFGDKNWFGTLAVSKYDCESGTIGLYEVLIQRDLVVDRVPFSGLDRSNSASISPFRLRILFNTDPTVEVNRQTDYGDSATLEYKNQQRSLHFLLMQAREIPSERLHPSMALWPPWTIRARHRTRRAPTTDAGLLNATWSSAFSTARPTASGRPSSLASSFVRQADPCPDLFRVKQWLLFRGTTEAVSVAETVQTFSRLDLGFDSHSDSNSDSGPLPGLWVGDYEVNGGEFVLISRSRAHRLEAVKITGDTHVPRGELTFVVEDARVDCGVRFPEWPEAKVLSAAIQHAQMHHVNAMFAQAYLVVVDERSLVLFCADFGAASYFYRVDADALLRRQPQQLAAP